MINSKKILPLKNFPIIGIGASAGGLSAFEEFFSGMPTNVPSNMAFVLVQHLDPDHKSILTSLIQRYTQMEVWEVKDSMTVKPNCIYIIPPGCNMELKKGKLKLSNPTAPRGQRLPIDFFFESLAKELKEHAICIILSGNGKDGTKGLQAIKAKGGMVMVQKPESIEHDGMPRSAINTELVDYELTPQEMYTQLLTHLSKKNILTIEVNENFSTENENSIYKIFTIIQNRTGHDFSHYKLGTLYRRIERRIVLNHKQNFLDYIEYLQKNHSEIDILFQDLLISVTNFFRDEEVFKILQSEIIPNLFENKKPASTIRVWVPGCATGEEAYSIAILLQEYMDTFKLSHKIQVFATDIDNRAIAFARAGLYPSNISSNISNERLSRFFVFDSKGFFRIQRRIRDIVIFSAQDVIKDPPFSKLDLVSCRNLLIYLGADLQKRLIPLFHYSLNPEGILLLGTSETIGEFTNLFSVLDRKWKFYQRKENFQSFLHSGLDIFSVSQNQPTKISLENNTSKPISPRKIPLRELTEHALLSKITPPSVLVNSRGDILYIHGRTGMFLEPSLGESGVSNILKMAREGLRTELSLLLKEIIKSQETVYRPKLKVKTNGHFTSVNITINIIKTNQLSDMESLYLVTFQEIIEEEFSDSDKKNPSILMDIEIEKEISLLRKELNAKEDYLQATNEELETSNEELKSSNEEMQSVNEELQSTNEELETSKEELQSINEELTTVNAELHSKLSELSQSNNDMNNLLAGTGIATIFLDNNLRILRFTPTATQIVNLIEGDIGRPIGHIISNIINYDSLLIDTQIVMETLVPKEIEVQVRDNKWYTLRILPYRTLNNVIEGTVINFVDITDRKNLEASLTQEKNKLEFHSSLLELVGDAVIASNLEGIILYWNKAAENLYGWKASEVIGKYIIDITPAEESKSRGEEIMNSLQKGETWNGEFLVQHKNGRKFMSRVTDTAILDDSGNISIIIGISKDITDRKQDEEKIQNLLDEKEILLKEVHHRIKNNMSTIYSLLSIQTNKSTNSFTSALLEDAKNRVYSMMLLYDKLYQSPSFNQMSVKNYFPSLIDDIIKNFPNSDSVIVQKNIEDFTLDAKRLQPLGILINELLTNIMKYAFPEKLNGLIIVSATEKDKLITFTIEDNGVGFPELDNLKTPPSFGLMLVGLLAKQLRGNLKIEQVKGTKITLTFEI